MTTLETPAGTSDLLEADPDPELDPEVDEGPYYSVDEFAKLFGVHPQTVRKWLKGGDIPAVRIGSTWRISASVLRAHSTPAAKQAS